MKVIFAFLDPENIGLDTNFVSLAQLLKKLHGFATFSGHCGGHLGFYYVYPTEVCENIIFGFLEPENLGLDTNFATLA